MKLFNPITKQNKDKGHLPLLARYRMPVVAALAIVGGSVNALPVEIQGPIDSFNQLPPTDCYSFPLLTRAVINSVEQKAPASLGWTTSGIIQRDHFLLADMTFSRIAKMQVGGYFDAAPSSVLSLTSADNKEFQTETPWYMYPRKDGGYLLLDLMDESDSQLLFVDKDNHVEQVVDTCEKKLFDEQRGRNVVLREVHRMVPINDSVMVNAVFLDYKLEKWWDAFAVLGSSDVYYPLEFADAPAESLKDLKEKFYSRDFTYMAAIGSTGYVLVMDERPWIGRVEIPDPLPQQPPKITRFADFPTEYSVPHILIPERRTFRDRVEFVHTIYRAVESSQMPVGLYPLAGRLFALVKSAFDEDSGQTEWRLIPVSENGEFGDPVRLPVSSHEIALVLGDDDFLGIIEKGGIDLLDQSPLEILYRPAHAGTFVPLSWLSDMSLQKQACRPVKVGE